MHNGICHCICACMPELLLTHTTIWQKHLHNTQIKLYTYVCMYVYTYLIFICPALCLPFLSIHPLASSGQSLYAWAHTNLQKSHECSCCQQSAVSSQQSPQQQHQPSWALSRNFAECAKSVKQRADKHTHTRTHPHTRTVCRLQSNAKAHKWYQTKECCGCVACRLDFMTTSSRCATMRLVLLPTCHIHAAFTLASERVGFGLWQRTAGSGPVRWRRLRQWSSGADAKTFTKIKIYTPLHIYLIFTTVQVHMQRGVCVCVCVHGCCCICSLVLAHAATSTCPVSDSPLTMGFFPRILSNCILFFRCSLFIVVVIAVVVLFFWLSCCTFQLRETRSAALIIKLL